MGHSKVARWTYIYGEFHRGIFKNRHLSNATGRIRDESLINQGGRALIEPAIKQSKLVLNILLKILYLQVNIKYRH
jgi:hypothetical protein